MMPLQDTAARERAATVADRNVVVTAGAGSGKTTLLVDRLVHLLLRRPEPLAVGEIVALTFTNKAANEMKLRLRERLVTLLGLDPATPPAVESRRRDWDRMLDLMTRYGLSKAVLDESAGKALRELEKSQIGTIHSFAAHLLRLYPVESGVDPAFQEDDGTGFREHFAREWELWLDQQLGPDGAQQDIWRPILRVISLDEARALAEGLANDLIPLGGLVAGLNEGPVPPPIRQWVSGLAAAARTLRSTHSKTTIIERMLEAAAARLDGLTTSGGVESSGAGDLDRDVPSKTTTWSKEDYVEAKQIIKVAQSVGHLDAGLLWALLSLLVPFAADCRGRFVQSGFVSFDGLLARARDLLRHWPAIRRELKTQFKAVLVDEFQDTDPVQYELILYLAEGPGQEDDDWRAVRLQPGKLFIVGDPKQSIYAFRRADMEAYDAVIEDRVLGQHVPGERQSLQTNFRTHEGLLTPINACFGRLFPATAVKGLHPQQEPLLPLAGEPPLPMERMEIRLVRPVGTEADAETATRAEAEDIARWLSEEVLGRQEIREGGRAVPIRPRHVAILLRTLTAAREYLEALRRCGIPYLTEGEKHFYERQEILDLVNLLRASADPHDQLALVGVLRSPVGGLPDGEIAALARAHRLDYRCDPGGCAGAAGVYALLRELHRDLPFRPVAEVVDTVFARVPLLELAAASLDGEQAVANLLKLRDLASEMSARPEMTLRRVIGILTKRVLEPPDEAESPLVEEGPDIGERDGAVRLLSIHKAKGLEFPVVILAGLHRGSDRRETGTLVQHDWSTGIVGIRCGEHQTLGGLYVGTKLAQRQRAELRRVLYVGMTRAKRRLVLSAGLPDSTSRMGDSFLALVGEGLGIDLLAGEPTPEPAAVAIGEGRVHVHVVEGRDVPLSKGGHEAAWQEDEGDILPHQARWEERAHRYEEARRSPLFMTPTALTASDKVGARRRSEGTARSDSEAARLIGTLAHRVLEGWDFGSGGNKLHERIDALCREFPPELRDDLHQMFALFFASKPYGELKRATILGREVPFIMPWEGNGQWAMGLAPLAFPCVMEGVIDLIYKLDGHLWIADYKTDRIGGADLAQRAGEYENQVRIYAQAVAQALGLDRVRAQVIFLRAGRAVEVG